MSQRRAKLQQELRALQGDSEPVEVCGKKYVYRKLIRRRAQVTLKSLISPFIRAMATAIEALKDFSLEKFVAGEVDFDITQIDVTKVADAIEALDDDIYWRLACRILDDVQVDDVPCGKLDDSDYYNDKNWEFVQAILVGIQVNYPFVGGLIQIKKGGSDDSNQAEEPGQESGE